jgi:DNA primase
MNELVQYANQNLTDSAREFLYGRGVTDEQIEKYQIGYVDNFVPPHANTEAFRVWSGGGSKLSNVLVFPLTNVLGEVKGFQFKPATRSVREYMDYFEGEVDEPVFFGLAQAMPKVWETKSVWLVEGIFDLFPIQRYFEAAFPTMTARVTDSLVRLMRRFVSKVWVGYDSDKKGRDAAWTFVKAHGKEFDAQIVNYPRLPIPGSDKVTKDPGDLWEIRGEQWMQSFVLSHLGTKEFDHA